MVQDGGPQLPTPAALSPLCHHMASYLSGTISPLKPLLLYAVFVMVFPHSEG